MEPLLSRDEWRFAVKNVDVKVGHNLAGSRLIDWYGCCDLTKPSESVQAVSDAF